MSNEKPKRGGKRKRESENHKDDDKTANMLSLQVLHETRTLIATFCDLGDIASLRRTCTVLRTSYGEPNVWKCVGNNITRLHKLSEPLTTEISVQMWLRDHACRSWLCNSRNCFLCKGRTVVPVSILEDDFGFTAISPQRMSLPSHLAVSKTPKLRVRVVKRTTKGKKRGTTAQELYTYVLARFGSLSRFREHVCRSEDTMEKHTFRIRNWKRQVIGMVLLPPPVDRKMIEWILCLHERARTEQELTSAQRKQLLQQCLAQWGLKIRGDSKLAAAYIRGDVLVPQKPVEECIDLKGYAVMTARQVAILLEVVNLLFSCSHMVYSHGHEHARWRLHEMCYNQEGWIANDNNFQRSRPCDVAIAKNLTDYAFKKANESLMGEESGGND